MLSFFSTATLLATTFSTIVSAAPVVPPSPYGRKSQIVAYYGQTANQGLLEDYCNDPNIDIIPIAFVNGFPGQNGNGDYPSANFGDQCGGTANGTNMFNNCWQLKPYIKQCQDAGKKILISIGGDASYPYSLGGDDDGVNFANVMWKTFGPMQAGYTGPRPFGDLCVDGFDFDIEMGGGTGYGAMANQLRSLMSSDMILTAAPQCVAPDANLADALVHAKFDHLYIQFYNTPDCSARAGVTYPNNGGKDIGYNNWATWLSNNVATDNQPLMFIGLPGSPQGVPNHPDNYLDKDDAKIILDRFYEHPMFGGVMLWDAAYAHSNPQGNYVSTIHDILVECGGPSITTTTTMMTTTTAPSSTPTSPTTTPGTTHPFTSPFTTPSTTPSTTPETTHPFSSPVTTHPGVSPTISPTTHPFTSPTTTPVTTPVTTYPVSSPITSPTTHPFTSPTTSPSTTSTSTSSTTTTHSYPGTTGPSSHTSFTLPPSSSTTSPSFTRPPFSSTTSSASYSTTWSESSSISESSSGWGSWPSDTTTTTTTTTKSTDPATWSDWSSTSSKPVDPSTSSDYSWSAWPTSSPKSADPTTSSFEHSWSAWSTTSSKSVDPSSTISSWSSWADPSSAYVTTTTTVYTDVCPTGFTKITATITATISVTDGGYQPTGKNSAWPTGSAGIPTGFYATTAVCSAGCGDGPTTVTLTIPIPSVVTMTVVPTPATPVAATGTAASASWSVWSSSTPVAAVTGGSWNSGSDPAGSAPVAAVSGGKVPDASSTQAANSYATGSPVAGYTGGNSNTNGIQTYTGGAAVEQAPATAFSVAVCVVLAIAGLVL